MKKNLFLSIFSLLTVLSCGEDRDDDNTTQETLSQKIVGTWTITKKENNGTNIPHQSPCSNHGNFVFNADKKLYENYNSNVSGNCVTDTDNYNYVIDENSKKITATNSYGDQMIYTISNFTDNSLVLTNVEGSETIKYTFSK
ncbi:lipocalin family protein [Chryseobacterium sp.]|uniref:lipocalin family protein n=1 Tax=Chryseobacterium sp. TaxID=1871047 RepID=UPI00289FB0A5|nr:lipocalin family protein [Chryseobacterium sp.]